MKLQTFSAHSVCLVLLVAGVLSAFAQTGHAADVTLRIGAGDAARSATVQTFDRDRVTYVPLGSLVRQLGGRFSSSSGRYEAEFEEKTARLTPGEILVSGPESEFALSNPVLDSRGEAWIALEDVTALFTQAFSLTPEQGDANDPELSESLTELSAESPPADDTPSLSDLPMGTALPSDAVVVIDPGHGGNDPGVQGQALVEKDLALALASQLQKELQALGLKAELTRTSDDAVAVIDRINAAIQHRGSVLISIHAGASNANSASGLEIYYPSETGLGDMASSGPDTVNTADRFGYARQSRDLAEAVASQLKASSAMPLRGVHSIRSPLLHHVPMPGLLLEIGVLNNPADEAALRESAFQEQFTKAVAETISRYLGVSTPADTSVPQEQETQPQ